VKIKTALVGTTDYHRELKWPEGWPVPSAGDSVDLPGQGGLAVRTVVWFPEGEDDDPEPFVYVVVGMPRP